MNKSGENRRTLPAWVRRAAILCGVIAVLAAAVLAAWWLLVVQNIAGQVTVEAGAQTVDANAYLIRDWNIPAAFITDLSNIDLNSLGDHPVEISYYGRSFNTVLRVVDTVSPEAVTRDLESFSFWTPTPSDFIREIRDVTQVTVEYAQEPDMSRAGEQTVELLLTDEGGNTAKVQATLTVIVDDQSPVIEGVQDQSIYRGQTPDFLTGVTVSDDLDEAPSLTVDDSGVDLTQGGTYEVLYTARDSSGNETVQTAILTVIADDTPPSILGVNPISLYTGSTVAYRSGILVTDDLDDSPVLTIDSTQVDLSQPGIYEVTYIATDAAGNESRVSTTVTVKEKTAAYVAEETIYAAADVILAQIIKGGMTDREKVEAIYRWVGQNCYYSNYSDKTDWLQAAYKILCTRTGDCFSFYAISKLFMDRLEIPNITVTRGENPYRSTSHYWSLVSVDGGETYYHFDTTPRSGNLNFCLVTDAYLDNYDEYYHHGYYARDKSLYPATPEE